MTGLELAASRELNVPFKLGAQGPKQEGKGEPLEGLKVQPLKKPMGAEWPRGP